MGREEINGTWQNYKDENFSEFLDAMGVGFMKKKIATSQKPKITLKIEGDVISVDGPQKESIKVGQTQEKTLPMNDAKMNITPRWDGDKLVTEAVPAGNKGKAHTTVREIINGELVTIISVDGIVCKRYFKRV